MTNREIFTKIFNNPTFKDHSCSRSCNMLVPCASCDWWNEEYADSEEKKPPFKIFISQPMKGRTYEEVMQERNRIWNTGFLLCFIKNGLEYNKVGM